MNLKRFDISKEYGGTNSIAPIGEQGSYIMGSTQEALKNYEGDDTEFVTYFPEAYLISAVSTLRENNPVAVGCQSVYRGDTAVGGNFGVLTTNRMGNAAKAIGCTTAIIGHCEERRDRAGILAEASVTDTVVVDRLLDQEIKAAAKVGSRALYCIGESDQEQDRWQGVSREQLEIRLGGVGKSMVTTTYEPIRVTGSDKTPSDKGYIIMTETYVKEVAGNMDIVCGGGSKTDNTGVLASIPIMGDGLIALTRFQREIGLYPEEYLEIIRTYMGR